MAFRFFLPKDKATREDVISNMVMRGRAIRNPHSVRWWIANAYLQGLREFQAIDYEKGTVSIAYLNESGVMKFRYDQIVTQYVTQLGRLMGINLAPRTKMKGMSLDGLRKSSVAQVVLDSAITTDKVDELISSLAPEILMYGLAGVGLWIEGPESQGLEVIEPWEILPVPVDATTPSTLRGMMRVRPVPVDWLKTLAISPGDRSKFYSNLEDLKIPRGNMPSKFDTMGDGSLSSFSGTGGFFIRTPDDKTDNTGSKWRRSAKAAKEDEKQMPITMLVEIWTETPDGFLADYGVYAGVNKFQELYFQDHSGGNYPMPVRVAHGIPTGSFWGRSYVDTLIPMNNEIEYALSSLFQAIADFDLYPMQLWPTTLGEPAEAERGQDGVKRLRYEPDYTCPDLRPQNVEPAKLTAPMVQIVSLATNLLDKLANQPSELTSGDAPGRTDSLPGMSFLWETSSIPLSPTAKSISRAVSGVFRALLRILKDKWTAGKVVSLTMLDDSLAGIVVDAKEGTMELGKNAIPYPDEVEVTVASELPVSKEQMRAELKDALAAQRITIDEYNQMARIKGLDLPIGDELGWQSYRRAMMENIILFGDGKVPGQVIVSEYDVPRVHEQVLLTFMARPEFYLGSAEVREAFVKHLQLHRTNRGNMPDNLPYAEEAAGQELNVQLPPQEF